MLKVKDVCVLPKEKGLLTRKEFNALDDYEYTIKTGEHIGHDKLLKEISELLVNLSDLLDEGKIQKVINDIDYDIDDYELRSDEGDYSPNEHEKTLMVDYLQGFIDEIAKALKEGDVWGDK